MPKPVDMTEHTVPAERVVIGAALMDERFVAKYRLKLTEEMFSEPHRPIWNTVGALWDGSATKTGPRVDKALLLAAAPDYHIQPPFGAKSLDEYLQGCIDEFDNLDQATRYAQELMRRSMVDEFHARLRQWDSQCRNGAIKWGGEEAFQQFQRDVAEGLARLRSADERFAETAEQGVRFAPSLVMRPEDHKPGYTLLLSEVAPPWVAEYIYQLSMSVDQIPMEFAFSVWLSTICGAFSMFHRLEAKSGYVVPPCIYVQCILPSGAGKDAIINAVTEPIRVSLNKAITDRRREVNKRLRVEQAKHKMRFEAVKARKLRLKKERACATSAESLETISAEEDATAIEEIDLQISIAELERLEREPALITDSPTVEAIAHAAEKNPGNLLFIIASEATVLGNVMTYSNNSTPQLGPLLKGIDGASYKAHRVGKDSEVVLDQILISMCLGTQPGTFELICKNPHFISQGLLWRFLICAPKFDGKRANNVCVEPYVMDRYMKHMEELILPLANYDIVRLPGDPLPENPEKFPKVIGMSQDARDAHEANKKELFDKAYRGGSLERWQSIVYKADANALKIAAGLHFVEHPTLLAAESSLVSRQTVEKAWKIVRFYLEHAICVYLSNGVDASSRDAKMHTLVMAMRISRKGPYHEWVIQEIKKLCDGRSEGKASEVKRTGVRLLNTLSIADLESLLIGLQSKGLIEIKMDGLKRMPRYVLTEQGRKYDPHKQARSALEEPV